MTKRILLTGASGFVGSHVLRHILTTTDWEVVCPVTFRHKGLSDRLVTAMEDQDQSRVTIVQTDLTAPISKVTAHKFGEINYILNVASESHVDRSIEEPAQFIQSNVALITNILDYARTLDNLEVFLQVSTDEVYGPAKPGEAHREWIDNIKPSNPYSASKAAQEAVAYSYWRTYDIPLIISNTMNIIGETQDPEKFFPKTLLNVLKGTEMTIHASAEGEIGSRYYLHARNQADGLLYLINHAVLLMSWPIVDEESGETESLRYSQGGTVPPRFHIVGEREVDNLEMAQLIAQAAGKELKYKLEDFHSSRPGHDLRYALDGTKIANIGWTAPVPLETSIKSTVDWTLSHPEWLAL
ncbi:UDP-glucose dehydrogenase [Arthrobacter phage Atuin]|nr:UDP-glucose dehydrogenase [Arthrobacter phage Atuin]